MKKDRMGHDEVDMIDYIKIIYKRRRMVCAIALVGMFIVGTYSLCQPKLYEAYATFFPINTNYTVKSESFTIEPKLDIEDLIISILESRKMRDRVIEDLNLKVSDDKDSIQQLQKSIERGVRVVVNDKGIIKLSVRTKSPKLSAKIANSYVDNLDYFNRQLDIGVQKQIVQIIDRASIPKKRMPRGTIGKSVKAGAVSFGFAALLALFLEFIKTSNIRERLREQ